MRRGLPALALVVSAAAPGVAQQAETGRYVPYSGIERGTEGVTPLALRIRNDGEVPILCTAALAHWYSEALGEAAPGAELTVPLWHDPATGAIQLLNALEDRMPVEAITCGPAADPHAARLSLPIAAGTQPAGLTRRCAPGPSGWTCR